MLPSRMSSWPG